MARVGVSAVLPPVIAGLVTGGASWVLGGAIVSAAPLYAGTAAAGGALGALLALNAARSTARELEAAKERAGRLEVELSKLRAVGTHAGGSHAQQQQQVRPVDAAAAREFLTGLGQMLKAAQEFEMSRSEELDRAARTALAALDDVVRDMETAKAKVARAAEVLAAAGGEVNAGARRA